MDAWVSRRALVGSGLALPLLLLPACATRLGDLSGLDEAVRRLLTLAAQRAFARLLTREGFFADDLARISLPSQLGGSAFTRAFAVLLGSSYVQDRLLRIVNDAASDAARDAAPVVYQAIRDVRIDDARTLLRGSPTAATELLQRELGEGLFDALYPGVGRVLRIADNGLVARALLIATGIDFPGLQADVTRKAALGLYRAIGREEAAIRADPAATAGDPLLARLFGRRR
ncbi:MAG: hypothetical protein QOJ94_3260 [Sphingomonadales bacterium]|jgi:hypothetical protein|nr:hypothetical protein [Sphingomonadales bacterium]